MDNLLSKNRHDKVLVNFVPMAGAERLSRSKVEFVGELTVRQVALRLQGMLWAERAEEPLHIFLVQGFAPSPENSLGDLFSSYATDSGSGGKLELVLKYSHQLVHG
jgi:hypothetical protein